MRSRRRLGHQTPSLLKRVGAPEERRSVDTKHGREERERGGADGSASPAGGAAPQPASANQHNQRNQRQHDCLRLWQREVRGQHQMCGSLTTPRNRKQPPPTSSETGG